MHSNHNGQNKDLYNYNFRDPSKRIERIKKISIEEYEQTKKREKVRKKQ